MATSGGPFGASLDSGGDHTEHLHERLACSVPSQISEDLNGERLARWMPYVDCFFVTQTNRHEDFGNGTSEANNRFEREPPSVELDIFTTEVLFASVLGIKSFIFFTPIVASLCVHLSAWLPGYQAVVRVASSSAPSQSSEEGLRPSVTASRTASVC